VQKFSSAHTDEDDTGNPLEGVTIPLDDEVFRCEGELSMLESSHLAAVAMSPGAMSDAAEAAAIAFALQQALGDAEYKRFREHCQVHDTPPRVVIDILQGINGAIAEGMEAATGRPTGRPEPSSPGPTGQDDRISKVVSFQRGTVEVVAPPAGAAHPEPVQPAPGQPSWDAPPGLAGKQPAKTTTVQRSSRGGGKPRAPRSRAS
jgi:hypothetical protein